jgi:hypothetical protein
MTTNPGSLRWRKSSYSAGNGGECVEVAHTLDALRDSKNIAGPVLSVPVPGLLGAIKAGRLA